MSPRWCIVALFFAVLAWPAAGARKPASPEEAVRVERVGGVSRVDAALPGRLVSYALRRNAEGDREILLLVRPLDEPAPSDEASGPENGQPTDRPRLPPCPWDVKQEATSEPLSLYRLDVAAAKLVLLRDDLPHDATALDVIESDGSGRQDLVLAAPGKLWRIDPDHATGQVSVLEDPDLRWKRLHPRAVRHTGAARPPWVAVTARDELLLYAPLEDRPRWNLLARMELPLVADVEEDGIEVWSERPAFVGRDAGGTLYFATPPDELGRSRVQTTLFTVTAAGDTSTTDCWARLPGREEVLGSVFLMLDDRPALLVTTKPADKLNLFGEKRLRIYPLQRDRSRLGLLPLFATETRMNLWQEGAPKLLDVNDDGRNDLVIGYWKGLINARVVLDVYLQREDGAFDKSARNTALDVSKGDRSFVQYGSDLTGDGLPDLLVRGKPGLLVYPGRASKSGNRLVEDKPLVIRSTERAKKKDKESEDAPWWFDSYSKGRPRLIDLDGDGTEEILLIRTGGKRDPGYFRVVRLAE